ncbi:hypothetical protein N8587_02860 [Akkermansiaceae bacterium]|nr:hypothetical protein [Akkermansiaceae bacterium]MDA8959401.1 hypothetical protein [bacterium]
MFSDPNKTRQIASIKANKVIDWSARYFFTDREGKDLGSVSRQGMRSIWRARYDVFAAGNELADFKIQEENPWTRILDGLLGKIPIVGFLTGYFCHPTYIATRADGTPVMRVRKQPAFSKGNSPSKNSQTFHPRKKLT